MSSWTNNQIYRLFYKDMTNTVEGSSVITTLSQLFGEVVQRPEVDWGAATCMAYPAQEPPDPHELIVYFVKDHSHSIIRRNPQDKNLQLGQSGTCRIHASGNISEVYMNEFLSAPARCIANMAFHELMHNRLNMDNRLHTDGGFGLASAMDSGGEFCAAPFNPFHLNEDNKRLMAIELLKPISQKWVQS